MTNWSVMRLVATIFFVLSLAYILIIISLMIEIDLF